MSNGNNNNPDSWNKWQNFVLQELGRYGKHHTDIFNKLEKINIDIAQLKIKSGIWGLLGGLIPVAVMLGIWILRGL